MSGYPSYMKLKHSYQYNRARRINVSIPDEHLSATAQGSCLLLFLFILYINDFPSVIKPSSILMYADDIKLFTSFNWSRSLISFTVSSVI